MAHIKDVLAYLLKQYPHDNETSNARVTKMIYLSDWVHCIREGRQITEIQWHFDNYGPYVHDVKRVAEQFHKTFEVRQSQTMYGDTKSLILLTRNSFAPALELSEMAAVDHVILHTKGMYWNEFIKTIYGTYPIASSERYSSLDLVAKAKEYGQVTG